MLKGRISTSLVLFMLTEAGAIFLTGLLSAFLRLHFNDGSVIFYDPYFLKTASLTLIYFLTFYYFKFYSSGMLRINWLMLARLLQATATATIILFVIFYAVPTIKTGRGILLLNTIILPIIIILWRLIFFKVVSSGLPKKNVLIIGTKDLASKIGAEIFTNKDFGLTLVGFIDDDPSKLGESIVNPGVIGGYGDISRLTQIHRVDMIIIALEDRRAKLPMSALLECKLKGISVEEGETFNERMDGKIPLDHLKPSWMVFSNGFKSLRSRKIIKRIFDIIAASIIFTISLPIMILTAIIIKLDSRGPVIFKQIRIGEHGKHFNIYKFRSMRQDAEVSSGPVWASSEDARVTRIGKIIRTLRIDELPQLVNVLKGDMSFVGPRPERPFFTAKLKGVIPYYEIRTAVKPGITGWAQIKYPYGASVEDALEKLQYDIYYIKNMSPVLDLIIFFMTIRVVLTGKGAR